MTLVREPVDVAKQIQQQFNSKSRRRVTDLNLNNALMHLLGRNYVAFSSFSYEMLSIGCVCCVVKTH